MQQLGQILRVMLLHIVLTALTQAVSPGALYPVVLVPFAAYLAASESTPYARGLLTAFVFGYLLDLFSGNRMGLATLMSVAVFVVVRITGLKLAPKDGVPYFAVIFVLCTMTILAGRGLRMLFEQREPIAFAVPAADPLRGWLGRTGVHSTLPMFAWFALRTLVTALASTIFAPVVYWVFGNQPEIGGLRPRGVR